MSEPEPERERAREAPASGNGLATYEGQGIGGHGGPSVANAGLGKQKGGRLKAARPSLPACNARPPSGVYRLKYMSYSTGCVVIRKRCTSSCLRAK